MLKLLAVVLILVSSLASADDIYTNEFETLVSSRLNGIELKDPHIFMESIGCTDFTGFVNDFLINSPFISDSDNDTFLDLNIVLQFKTDQPSYLVTNDVAANMIDANCPDPLFSGPCLVNQVVESNITTTSEQTNSCLVPLAGTTSAYTDPVINSEAPCFVTEPTDFILSILGVNIPLQSYQQAARYEGGLSLDQGLHMGFISETAAMKVVFPVSLPFVGGSTLYDLLPGGGSCSLDDDRDIGPDDITLGWWFYFNSNSDLIDLE